MAAHRCSRAIKLLSVAFLALLPLAFAQDGNSNVHILFLTDCTMYSDWQSVAMVFSFSRSRQVGGVTRVMCCTDEEKVRYNQELMNMVPTHIAPSFALNVKTNDHYAAYNKPGAVVDFMAHNNPSSDWILVLDSDMLLRKPLYPERLNVERGWCISADYTYMVGVTNELAERHIPEIAPRNDTLAGPKGRRADQVGGWFFLHRDDLKRVAPLWLSITEEVREDPEAWRLTGDQYVKKGERPWISEMYGYAFAAAKSNVWHKWNKETMTYPNYIPAGIPLLVHYGLEFSVTTKAGVKWVYDKHWHYDFDVTKCPPWDLSNPDPKERTGGVFPWAPRPSELALQLSPSLTGQYDLLPLLLRRNPQQELKMLYRELIAIETLSTLNAGFCEYHLKHCPASTQLETVCNEAMMRYNEVIAAAAAMEAVITCQDWTPKCEAWAQSGECQRNKAFMTESCRKSCNSCDAVKAAPVIAPADAHLNPLTSDPDHTREPTAHGGHAPDLTEDGPVVIPRETEGPIEQAAEAVTVASPPVATASQPPQPPPPARPVAVRSAQAGRPPPVSARLLTACYRMSASLSEVKDCIAAAKRGEAYARKLTGAPQDAPQQAGSGADKQEAGVQAATHDAEDLRLTIEHARHVQPPSDVISSDEEQTSILGSLVSHLTVWHALGLWFVFIAAVLIALPKIVRARRRNHAIRRND